MILPKSLFSKAPLISVVAFFVFIAVAFASCSTFSMAKVGVNLILLEYDGDELIIHETQVRDYLKNILNVPDNYTMHAYTRKAISPDLKKTSDFYHSFYVVKNDNVDYPQYFTLSFNGTRKRRYSQGAWAINTETDLRSYIDYRFGTNSWEVQEIPVRINTKKTVAKILHKIDNEDITYYVNDHKNNRYSVENCITALQATLVEY